MVSSGWLGSKAHMEECVTAALWEVGVMKRHKSSTATRLSCVCNIGAADLCVDPMSLPLMMVTWFGL